MVQIDTRRAAAPRVLSAVLAIVVASSSFVASANDAAGASARPAGSALRSPAALAAGVHVNHGPGASKRIALTIDDGASPAACRAILEILRRKRVPATFFPVAQYVVRSPALWREIAAQGFPIGNHTAHHAVLTRLSYAGKLQEIVQARRMIEDVTGVRMIRVLRPPTGEWDGSVLQAAAAAGFPTVLTWDTTFGDTSPTPNVAHQIHNAERGRNGSVILMHCKALATQTLEPVIDFYLARGFTFVTVPQLFGFAGPVPKFPPLPGRPAVTVWPWRWRD